MISVLSTASYKKYICDKCNFSAIFIDTVGSSELSPPKCGECEEVLRQIKLTVSDIEPSDWEKFPTVSC
jgi:hypothetical protein